VTLLSRQRRQTGIGLVEIMVALVVSSLLIGGLIQIFSSNKQAYVLQDEMSRLQENGRFAFHFLMKDLRMAGYFGCRNNVPVQNNLDTSSSDYDFSYDFAGSPLVAYNADDSGGWSPALPASIQALEPLPGNDIVLIRSADASSVSLTPPYQSGDASKASIHLEKGHGLSKGDIAVVSDCSQATVVQITGEGGGGTSAAVTNNTGNSASPGNATSSLGHNYGQGAIISKIQSNVFYVANNVAGVPSLFRKKLTAGENAEELVAGVDQLSFRYGIDSNEDRQLDSYTEAPTTSQLNRIMAVRTSMLLRGERQNIVDGEQGFVLDGDVINRDDGRLRYVMSSTATVRNRAP
jgi:type IV pilus assembly protein PilW